MLLEFTISLLPVVLARLYSVHSGEAHMMSNAPTLNIFVYCKFIISISIFGSNVLLISNVITLQLFFGNIC